MYPDQILAAIQSGWLWLALQGPAAQPAVVLALAFGIPWLLRTVVSAQWETVTDAVTDRVRTLLGAKLTAAFRKAIQAVPSLCIAAAFGVLVEGGDIGAILRLEFYAVFAPLIHEALKRYQGGNPPAARQTVRLKKALPRAGTALLLMALCLPLSGCTGSLVNAQRDALSARYGADSVSQTYEPSAHCRAIDERRATWGAVAKGAAVLTGASGLSVIPTQELRPEHRGPANVAIASTAVVAATVAAVAVAVEESAGEQWVRECLP